MRAARRGITRLYRNIKPSRQACVERLHQTHKWSQEEAQARQNEKLAETLQWCLQEIPFYQKRVKLDAKAITAENAQQALQAFPVLTSAMVNQHFDQLHVNPLPDHVFLNRSGGTTGQPTSFYLDRFSEDWVRATKWYLDQVTGLKAGDSKWVIWGSSEEFSRRKRSRKARLASWLGNDTWIQGFSLSDEDLDQILDTMMIKPPALVLAYTDIVDRLAKRAEDRQLNIPNSIHFMVTAGTLYAPIRQRIERVFGPVVFNRYGSREFGDMAMSCTAGNSLHVVGLTHFLEIADECGNRLAQGEAGEILVTSLVNRSMPLVRYAIKDWGSISTEACACGNPWHRIERLDGRSQDLFFAPDGRKISPNAMVHFCWAYGTHFKTRVQMVQTDMDRIEVHLQANGQAYEKDEDFEGKMRWELETLFRVPLSIDIIWKEKMDYTPTGKYRMIRRAFALAAP